MSHRLHILDVFAEEKYAGNQLAVVTGASDLSKEEMQKIARETNFSETTFVIDELPEAEGWRAHIFTPKEEIPFAGHPTIGTAWVIRRFLAPGAPPRVDLRLAIGTVPVMFDELERESVAWMHTSSPEFGDRFEAGDVADLLGLDSGDIATASPVEAVTLGIPFTFVPVASLDAMRRARFRSDRWEELQNRGFPGCMFLFCRETYARENQINARMFATPYGITEDPATGSANACLGAYLLRHGVFDGDGIDVRVEQGMEIGRPSLLRVRARRDGDGFAIEVGGRVLETIRGELL